MLLGGLESYIEQTTSVERITQELRLASHENEKVDWLVGAYYNDEDGPDLPERPCRRAGHAERHPTSSWARARSTRSTRNTRPSRT